MATNPTVREFGDLYFNDHVEGKLKSAKDFRRYLDSEIYPAFGAKLLKELDALDVQALVYRKRDNGRIAAAMRIRLVLKQIFD